jgi:hypothetical protein
VVFYGEYRTIGATNNSVCGLGYENVKEMSSAHFEPKKVKLSLCLTT